MKNINENHNKYPLWIQTASVFTIIITLVITILIADNYIYNRGKVIETYVNNTNTVLELELDTLSQYIKELTSFAIQPCFDNKLIRIIESQSGITDEDIDYIKEQMKAYYYTRNDLNSYELFLMNRGIRVGRGSGRGNQYLVARSIGEIDPEEQKAFDYCSESAYFLNAVPSEDASDFFTFYHSIIQIKDKSSLAFVKCSIDKDFLNTMIKSYHLSEGEVLLIFNPLGEVLYCTDREIMEYIPDDLTDNFPVNYYETEINGTKYLAMCSSDDQYGFKMVSLKPYRILMGNILDLLRTSLIQGVIVWFIAVIIIYLAIRYLMKPLNKLAEQMKKVGEGDFDSKINIGGSSEITNLGNAFNYMSEHIDRLITENYLVKINEQTARLIALEAQINPHFLYNTLQAISTEALVNDQDQIHEMVISLASILRYSIKGGDLVTLADESAHVDKYIYLQKIRMGDNLKYNIDIEEDAYTCKIPKICLQTLVENSIVHGIGGDVTSIEINVKAYIKEEKLFIEAKDNGCGMDEERLNELRGSFKKEILSATHTQGVGLANLYGRLNILFKEDDSLVVESRLGEGTIVKITLPVRKGMIYEGTDN